MSNEFPDDMQFLFQSGVPRFWNIVRYAIVHEHDILDPNLGTVRYTQKTWWTWRYMPGTNGKNNLTQVFVQYLKYFPRYRGFCDGQVGTFLRIFWVELEWHRSHILCIVFKGYRAARWEWQFSFKSFQLFLQENFRSIYSLLCLILGIIRRLCPWSTSAVGCPDINIQPVRCKGTQRFKLPPAAKEKEKWQPRKKYLPDFL